MKVNVSKPEWVTFIVKIVGPYCNLKCTYCIDSLQDQGKRTFMSDPVLTKVIREALRYGDRMAPVAFIWYGGEPLLAGINFFERIVQLQKEYNRIYKRQIRNSVQTNGTLLDQEWIRWFARHRFQVGVSIDGTQDLHNRYRPTRGGGATWDRAIQGYKLAQKEGIAGRALITVHAETGKQGHKVIRNLYQLGIRAIGLNPYFEPDPRRDHSNQAHLFISSSRYTQFLLDAIETWLQIGDPSFSIREIDNLVKILVGTTPDLCVFNGTCHHFITVFPDGNVYPCDAIPPSPEVLFGNITTQSLDEIFSSESYQNFLKRVHTTTRLCQQCPLGQFCHNGCTHHRLNGKYLFCESYKEAFSFLEMNLTPGQV